MHYIMRQEISQSLKSLACFLLHSCVCIVIAISEVVRRWLDLPDCRGRKINFNPSVSPV